MSRWMIRHFSYREFLVLTGIATKKAEVNRMTVLPLGYDSPNESFYKRSGLKVLNGTLP